MSERDEALALADRVLDRHSADPDDDLAVLARQFLRAAEANVVLTREKEEGRGALAWVVHCWIVEKGLSGELRKMCPADISHGLQEVIGKSEPPSGRGDLLMEIAQLRWKLDQMPGWRDMSTVPNLTASECAGYSPARATLGELNGDPPVTWTASGLLLQDVGAMPPSWDDEQARPSCSSGFWEREMGDAAEGAHGADLARWIALYLEHNDRLREENQIAALARVIYPTPFGHDTAEYQPWTARNWATQAKKAHDKVTA